MLHSIMNRLTIILILTVFSACEGFKVLAIHNDSDHEAKVTLRPGFDQSNIDLIYDYPTILNSDSSVVVLQPDSSVIILSIFTGMMFNVKINEKELRTDYLKIETLNDTILATSREEIIKLIYAKQKGNIKGEGRNFSTIKIE